MADRRLPRWVLATAWVVWAVGCGGEADSGRVPLHGLVQVEGARVTAGSLSLLPAQGHSGPAASTSIVDGKYAFTTATGPVPGPHLAVIGVLATANMIGTDSDSAISEDRQGSPAASKSRPIAGAKHPDSQTPASNAQWELTLDVPSAGDFRADLELGTH